MIATIIESISISLHQEFGDDYEIYMETMKQDLREPCFFISCLNLTIQPFLGKRYVRTNQFCIQYFPQSEDVFAECYAAAERMVWCLEQIQTEEGLICGTNKRYEVIDGILHFFVNYDCFVEQKQEAIPMEQWESKIQMKGGDLFGKK